MIQKPKGVSKVTKALSIGVALLLSLVAATAAAQNEEASGPDPWSGVEEMIVSGTANQASLLRETSSVTAFDAETLQKQGITNIQDVGKFTPNLEIKTAGSTTPALFIRGVGLNSFDANAAGAVAVYHDDVALNLPAFQAGQLFDLDGIEVLKGPQGSGPGWNASAGAIRIRSRKPTGDFGGFLRADYGNYDFLEVEGAVGMPIVADTLSSRIAFKYRERAGTVTNRCGDLPPFDRANPSNPINQLRIVSTSRSSQSLCGETLDDFFFIPNPSPPPRNLRISTLPAGLEKDLNNLGDWGARGQLRLQLETFDMDWNLNLHGSEIDQLGTVGQPLGTSAGYLGSATAAPQNYNEPEIRAEFDELLVREGVFGIPASACRADPACVAGLARAQNTLARRLAEGRPLDRDPFTGSYNLPGYERQQTWGLGLTGEATIGGITFKSVTGFDRYDRERLVDFDFTPTVIFEFDSQDDAWQFVQEVRAEKDLEVVPVVVRAGAYTIIEELDFIQETIAGGDVRPLVQSFEQQTYAFTAFGEADWELSETLELKGGLRFNWERKEFKVPELRVTPLVNICTQGFSGTGVNLPECESRATFSDPSGFVSLTYRMTEDVSAFAKYTRGWKGSQFNVANGTTRNAFTRAKPETIDAIEFGVNTTWFNGRLGFNAAMFLYRYENYQVFIFTNDSSSPPQRIVENASAARVYGADGEFRLEPIDRLVLKVDWSWIESAFLDFKDSGIRRIAIDPITPPRISEVPIDFTGNSLPNTPRFKVSVRLEYGFQFSFGTITPLYSMVYTGDTNFDPSNGRGAPNDVGRIFLPKNTIGQAAYVLHDFRLGYASPDDTIQLAFWIRNMTNEVYKQVAFDATAIAGLVGNWLGAPRTYGLSAKVSF